MRAYERNGIHIDHCSECRGVFLDRGELEHLMSAEAQWVQAQPAPAPAPSYPQGGYPQGGYAPAPAYGYGKPYKKRKNFLEELFD